MSQVSTPGAGIQNLLAQAGQQQVATEQLKQQAEQQKFEQDMTLKSMDLQKEQIRADREFRKQQQQFGQEQFAYQKEQDVRQNQMQQERMAEERRQHQAEMAQRQAEMAQALRLATENREANQKAAAQEAQRAFALQFAELRASHATSETRRIRNESATRIETAMAVAVDQVTGGLNTFKDYFKTGLRNTSELIEKSVESHQVGVRAAPSITQNAPVSILMSSDENDVVVSEGGLTQAATPIVIAAAAVFDEVGEDAINQMGAADIRRLVELKLEEGVTDPRIHSRISEIMTSLPREAAGVLGPYGGAPEGSENRMIQDIAFAVIADRATTDRPRLIVRGGVPMLEDKDDWRRMAEKGKRGRYAWGTRTVRGQVAAGGAGGDRMARANLAGQVVSSLMQADGTGMYTEQIETPLGTTTVGDLVAKYLADPNEDNVALMQKLATENPEAAFRVATALNQAQAAVNAVSFGDQEGDTAAGRMMKSGQATARRVFAGFRNAASEGQTVLGYRDPREVITDLQYAWDEIVNLSTNPQDLERVRDSILPTVLDELEYLEKVTGNRMGPLELEQYNNDLKEALIALAETMLTGSSDAMALGQGLERFMTDTDYLAQGAGNEVRSAALEELMAELPKEQPDFGAAVERGVGGVTGNTPGMDAELEALVNRYLP